MKKPSQFETEKFNLFIPNWEYSNPTVLEQMVQEARINEEFTAQAGRRVTDQAYTLMGVISFVILGVITFLLSQITIKTVSVFYLIFAFILLFFMLGFAFKLLQLIKSYNIKFPGAEPKQFATDQLMGISPTYSAIALQTYYLSLLTVKQKNINHNTIINAQRFKNLNKILKFLTYFMIYFTLALLITIISL